jgi:hypothetical protein
LLENNLEFSSKSESLRKYFVADSKGTNQNEDLRLSAGLAGWVLLPEIAGLCSSCRGESDDNDGNHQSLSMRLSENRGRNENTEEYWNMAEVNPP